uniref:Uncharacterized protein n=1 Tax=Lotharella oceanica TaxID=641309 RepID=A0A7S2X5T0_9EUKA|mmetsp:Transcript_12014/g.23139  ORF Transcript_12014/g.23139 Transcript_12014/m.23139 type:complete len:108 (+) Transcript_12014:115-438(+)|eukprot:CAMPEP_0170186124 /NCGR_PEP_ID=MMETSP0040_2-20121228/38345_1 /TAXON_ID=641309 /ORGANISM="Lotharella oceanica, Strain CCMP622" /LENGTH=107 /DNA_ID=CAMNT_0010432753 /DNA_START=66 /DNA_END=389 /DNA_ORIENTATION=-
MARDKPLKELLDRGKFRHTAGFADEKEDTKFYNTGFSHDKGGDPTGFVNTGFVDRGSDPTKFNACSGFANENGHDPTKFTNSGFGDDKETKFVNTGFAEEGTKFEYT